MAPSPPKKKTPAKKADKRLKMDYDLFRSIQHFKRYKDYFMKGTIIQERFCGSSGFKRHIYSHLFLGQRLGKVIKWFTRYV